MGLPYFIVAMALAIDVQPNPSPDQVVRAFYSTDVALHSHGLPDSTALKSITRFISPGFAKLLRQAQAAEAACVKDTPAGLKPPIWETAIFAQTWGDATGADRILVKTQSSKSASVVAALKYLHDEPHEINLELSSIDGIWVITDLKYPDGTSLSEQLRHYVRFKCAFL
ncbi:MAG: DUF3828 domain-containing protein [Rudaea sp.]|uniref:DUF3828 domain-containing protein n=1 Tax=unclassified Rudaea TaxID=2627037 RepID=UPI0010FA21C2|nr:MULTISPECIES: DUF3828 domain-containing protein [unclassified Rudaea]MBN8884943.1 DUF3828 domain-containing protein [Rudaea sp.]MBR0344480.1 DUF3828 domain-containing protein [Rudaea sp.]